MELIFAFIDGIIWSAIWIVILTIMIKIYPKSLINSNSKNEQKLIHTPQIKNKTLYYMLTLLFWIIIIGYLIYSGLSHYKDQISNIRILIMHTFIVTMVWNIVNLLMMDFLCICKITPNFIILKENETNKYNRNSLFYLKNFLKLSAYSIVTAIIIGSVNFFILKMFIWKS